MPDRRSVRLARARGQRLHRPPGAAVDAVRHLLAVQAQDARAARLALRARVDGPVSGEGLLAGWLMRGTLHLVCVEDYRWLHALTAPRQAAGNRRRLRQLGVTEAQADRAVALIAKALEDGPLERAEIARRLAARDIPVAGQAIVHLVGRAAQAGVLAVAPDRRLVALDAPAAAPEDPLAELGRRYVAAHAGATAEDLAHWSGLPVRAARAAMAPAAEAHDEPVRLRLLPAYDELLLGWRDRSPTVAPEHARRVHPGGGVLRAVVLDDGEAAGTWTLRAGKVAVDLFWPVDEAALAAEIAAVEDF